jgi:LuxR family transcriptional regulator, maltose regulon positive regulatory protein
MALLLRQVAERGVASLYVARLLAAIQASGGNEHGAAGARGASAARDSHPLPPGVEALTPREVEVLRLLAAGASNQRIADELTVSIGTVKAHTSHILGKLGAGNRTEAVARARHLGLLGGDSPPD